MICNQDLIQKTCEHIKKPDSKCEPHYLAGLLPQYQHMALISLFLNGKESPYASLLEEISREL